MRRLNFNRLKALEASGFNGISGSILPSFQVVIDAIHRYMFDGDITPQQMELLESLGLLLPIEEEEKKPIVSPHKMAD